MRTIEEGWHGHHLIQTVAEDLTVTPAEDDILHLKNIKYSVGSLKNFTSFPIKNTMNRKYIILSTKN